ncbi:MAG: restriction endonuclease subunit S [Pseudomonadota bacterium]|uniref:restriction endonuclease subunit S n=1 Tax=Gemmatimonas sp. TaxID=1962908 RepID=UPI0022CA3F7E|nr:hypothetical protein [Gemmatimonas sp.]MCZ8010446.1 hypothetical protein [Gemmatimonas sp.]MCZ8267009.1 hypothetical protein [Gemmatimonas sp.]
MSFPRYPEYKDSGVEWLGQVPAHWGVPRLRFTAQLNPSKNEVRQLPAETAVTFLPMEAIGEDGSVDLSRERTLADVAEGYTFVRDGDVAFAKITPCFENGKGAIMRGLQNGIGFGTTELIVVRPDKQKLSPSFLHYLFTSTVFRQAGESSMYGAGGQKRVPDSFVRDAVIPLPPTGEQEMIGAFLDHEIDKLDALVAEQERLIALLKEKRQAVISHAVTKGLNPDAPIKDSGVEWLGAVPAHWSVIPLKFLASIRTGIAKGKEHGSIPVVDLPYLRVANVQDGHLDLSEIMTMPVPVSDVPRYLLQAGDVLMNEGGDFDKLGRGAVWNGEIERCVTQNHVFAVRPTLVSSEWLAAYSGSAAAQFYFMSRSKQSTNLASISSTNIMELPVVMPPESEQATILNYLKAARRAFDELGDNARLAVELLRGRREALITAAVTGQIDVRGLAPAEAA